MQCCSINDESILFEAHIHEARGTTIPVVEVLVILFNVVVGDGEVLIRVVTLELGGGTLLVVVVVVILRVVVGIWLIVDCFESHLQKYKGQSKWENFMQCSSIFADSSCLDTQEQWSTGTFKPVVVDVLGSVMGIDGVVVVSLAVVLLWSDVVLIVDMKVDAICVVVEVGVVVGRPCLVVLVVVKIVGVVGLLVPVTVVASTGLRQ